MEKIRDTRWDVLKGILILCVLYRHFIIHGESLDLLASKTVANFIHFFTMPLFVFVSGYFTRHVDETKRYWLGILGIFETYAVYQILKGTLYHYSLWQLISITAPMMWYLLALIYWKITYFCFYRLGIKVNGVLIMTLVIIALAVGFVPFIGRSFAISRTCYFAPYFFLGIMLQNVQVMDEIKLRLKAPIAWLILVIALVGSLMASIHNVYGLMDDLFRGREPYPQEDKWIFMGLRFLSYLVSFIVSISIVRLFAVPNRTLEIVGKDSLKFYMFHGLALMAFGVLPIPWKYGLAIVYATIVTLIIFFFNKTKLSDFAIRPINYIVNLIKSKKQKNSVQNG